MLKEVADQLAKIDYVRPIGCADDQERVINLNAALPLAGLKVLEIGTLDGYHACQLAKLDADVTATDVRLDNLTKALMRSITLGLRNIKFAYLDIDDMSGIAKDEFDLLFCSGVMYHLKDPLATLYNIKDKFKHILWEGHTAHPNKEKLNAFYNNYDIDYTSFAFQYTEYAEPGYDNKLAAKDVSTSKWFTKESWYKFFGCCGLKIVSTLYEDFPNPHGPRSCWLLERNT